MKAAGCADGKLLSRCRVLKALEAVSRPYRIVVSGRTLATFRRKIDVLGRVIKGALQRKTRRG